MHTSIRWLLTIVAAAQIAEGAQSMRPGLWEYTSTMKSRSGEMEKAMKEMQEQMASMPPEQRKMMQDMMAPQGVSQTDVGTKIKVCITKEDVKRDMVPPADNRCKQNIIRKSGNTVWFKYNCKGNPPSSGEGEYTFVSDKIFKGNMTMHTTVEGRTDVIQMNQTGKWLSDNCGNVKPHP